jgi:hypothetical protein
VFNLDTASLPAVTLQANRPRLNSRWEDAGRL